MLSKAVKQRREHNRVRHFFHLSAPSLSRLKQVNDVPSLSDVQASAALAQPQPKTVQRAMFISYMLENRRVPRVIPFDELKARQEQFRIDVLTGAHTDIYGWPARTIPQQALYEAGFAGLDLKEECSPTIPSQPPIILGGISANGALGSPVGMPTSSELSRIRYAAFGNENNKLLEIITPGDDPDEFDASEMMAMGISPSESELIHETQEDEDEVDVDADPGELDEDDAGREPDPAEDALEQ